MNDINELLERYYNGETTLEEEQQLREYLAAHPEAAAAADGLLFAGIHATRQEQPTAQPKARPRRILWSYWAAAGGALAAGLALLIGLRHASPAPPVAAAQPPAVEILVTPHVSGEIRDEQQALEQARKALAFVSSKLHKGSSGIDRLNRLEQCISKIQTKDKS